MKCQENKLQPHKKNTQKIQLWKNKWQWVGIWFDACAFIQNNLKEKTSYDSCLFHRIMTSYEFGVTKISLYHANVSSYTEYRYSWQKLKALNSQKQITM